LIHTENKLGVMPVKRLLVHMSWPIMLSMFVQALYNLVDSIFVARLSEDAFLALSLAFPVQTLMIAVCLGTGVGVNALLSQRLGQKRYDAANAVAHNGFFVYLCCWLVFLIFGLTASGAYFSFFTANPIVLEYGRLYLSIVSCCSIGMCMQFATERVLQASGHPMGHMIVQGIGAIVNLILDPILIFGLFGFPMLGVAGAAVATVGGQLVGMCAGFVLVSRVKELKLDFRGFRPCGRTIADIYRIGLPAIVAQSFITLMIIGMNKLLSLYSSTLVVVLGYYFKLQTFLFMPVFGLSNGMVPVVGFNYGAKSKRRIISAIGFAVSVALSIMVPGIILMQFFPAGLLNFFQPSEASLAIGIQAFRIISFSFPLAAVSIILSASFQAMGAPMLSLLVSLTRQLFVVLPAMWVLGLIDPSLVWWSIPIAEAVGSVLSLLLYRHMYRTNILKLGDPEDSKGGA